MSAPNPGAGTSALVRGSDGSDVPRGRGPVRPVLCRYWASAHRDVGAGVVALGWLAAVMGRR
jgi:hypothetical protein